MTRRMRRALWGSLGVVTLLVVMAVGVFPTRQYLDQRQHKRDLESQVRYYRNENQKLEQQIRLVGTTEKIEAIAREEFGYVRPLEENYIVVVPNGLQTRVPSPWPF